MTRDELTHLYESALVDFITNTPCVKCGGNEFLSTQNIKMSAYFLVEISERWKDKQAAKMSISKAA